APKSLFPVPVTLQTLVALAVGTAFGWRLGAATILLYFSLGALGLPVFAQGSGIHNLWTAPTAGYLHGFLFGAVLMGWFASLGLDRSAAKLFPAMLAGHAVIYFFGLMWLASYVGMNAALAIGFKPFVIADILKCALGAQLFPLAWKALKE
ncbi:MAG: biotin transporter BioY, partial [Pseudomonadota bacterium]